MYLYMTFFYYKIFNICSEKNKIRNFIIIMILLDLKRDTCQLCNIIIFNYSYSINDLHLPDEVVVNKFLMLK